MSESSYKYTLLVIEHGNIGPKKMKMALELFVWLKIAQTRLPRWIHFHSQENFVSIWDMCTWILLISLVFAKEIWAKAWRFENWKWALSCPGCNIASYNLQPYLYHWSENHNYSTFHSHFELIPLARLFLLLQFHQEKFWKNGIRENYLNALSPISPFTLCNVSLEWVL